MRNDHMPGYRVMLWSDGGDQGRALATGGRRGMCAPRVDSGTTFDGFRGLAFDGRSG